MAVKTSSKKTSKRKVAAYTIRFDSASQLVEAQRAARIADLSFNKFVVRTLEAAASVIIKTPKPPSVGEMAGRIVAQKSHLAATKNTD